MIGKLFGWLMAPPIDKSKLAAKVDAMPPHSGIRPQPVQPSPQAEQIKEAVAENITKTKKPRAQKSANKTAPRSPGKKKKS
jgi:hypothetical protein